MDFSCAIHNAFEDDLHPSLWKIDLSNVAGNSATAKSAQVEFLHLFLDPKERQYWIKRLPQLENLRYLEIKSKLNQELFEAICAVPNLERLHIFWSDITDLTPIKYLKKLTHFTLGSSPKLETLDPLAELKSLISLCISGNHRAICDISPVSDLHDLQGLALCGADYTTQHYDTLSPLSSLRKIVFFAMIKVKAKDRNLQFIASFPKLKYLALLSLSNWPAKEFQLLHQCLPGLDCEELKLAATDATYRRKKRII
jgi:Leucine-rich repeat (LRR) protein